MDVLHHLVLPAFTLGITLAATVSRLSRSAMLEVISQDYIRTARAKGLVRAPGGLQACAAEHDDSAADHYRGLHGGGDDRHGADRDGVHAPGLGKMLVDAIGARDYPLAQGAITVFTMMIIVVNLLVDILYAAFDPRIVYS